MATLHNRGITVTVQFGTLAALTSADAQMSGQTAGTIVIDPSNMTSAEANGEDAGQVLYHELDHLFYESSPGFWSNMPKTATFTIGGTTYVYATGNIACTKCSPPGSLTNSLGEMAWEHMLIHNDLLDAFGKDNTGALSEGLAGASNAPDQKSLPGVAKSDAKLTGYSSHELPQPPQTAQCSGAANAPASASRYIIEGGVSYVDSGLSEGY